MTTPQLIIALLRKKRFSLHNEKALQREMEDYLIKTLPAGEVRREHILDPGSIIDFLIAPGIGIEVKTKGAKRDILKQCTKYCTFEEVKALILVTNLAMGFPDQLNGKDCYVLKLGAAWL